MKPILLFISLAVLATGCKQKTTSVTGGNAPVVKNNGNKKPLCCESNLPSRFPSLTQKVATIPGLNGAKD